MQTHGQSGARLPAGTKLSPRNACAWFGLSSASNKARPYLRIVSQAPIPPTPLDVASRWSGCRTREGHHASALLYAAPTGFPPRLCGRPLALGPCASVTGDVVRPTATVHRSVPGACQSGSSALSAMLLKLWNCFCGAGLRRAGLGRLGLNCRMSDPEGAGSACRLRDRAWKPGSGGQA
jgi:hypothetical protein